MRDPAPENIDGSKVERHVFKHSIEWGHVALGIGMLAVAYVVLRAIRDRDSDDDKETSSPV